MGVEAPPPLLLSLDRNAKTPGFKDKLPSKAQLSQLSPSVWVWWWCGGGGGGGVGWAPPSYCSTASHTLLQIKRARVYCHTFPWHSKAHSTRRRLKTSLERDVWTSPEPLPQHTLGQCAGWGASREEKVEGGGGGGVKVGEGEPVRKSEEAVSGAPAPAAQFSE